MRSGILASGTGSCRAPFTRWNSPSKSTVSPPQSAVMTSRLSASRRTRALGAVSLAQGRGVAFEAPRQPAHPGARGRVAAPVRVELVGHRTPADAELEAAP